MENIKIKIGVIADDFTGAGDAASFLSKSGARTIMFTTIPNTLEYTCDTVVIALKTRSVPHDEAIAQTNKAIDFLKKIQCEKIYFKYCSTFDSTPKGNIGVVLDFLMDNLNQDYSIICPSLPVNGRTVKDGILYVHGVPLSESPMKDHPLNPMWDSYIPTLMKEQSKYPCYDISMNNLKNGQVDDLIKEQIQQHQRFYLVPDYVANEDGMYIAEKFKNLSLLSGGSGLLEHMIHHKNNSNASIKAQKMKNQQSIILCGSCSSKTQEQVKKYKDTGGLTYAIDSKKLLNNDLHILDVFNYVQNLNQTVLIYSNAIDQKISNLKKCPTFYYESNLVEKFMADLAVKANDNNFQRIIVAGGETSGAVTLALGYTEFYIGESLFPGIPILYPCKNKNVSLILKSGNFGSEDFFLKVSKDCKHE